jgi:hypothetical protein
MLAAAVGVAGDGEAELDGFELLLVGLPFELLLVRPTMPVMILTITPIPTITFQAIWKIHFILYEIEFLGPLLGG